jgi:hypothetical protein
MTGMMLTAFDAASATVLDITAMNLEQRDQVHGRRTARRNGYDIICRECARPVFFVHNHHQTEFWRHGPDGARTCLLSGITIGESIEHYEAKVAIVTALRDLTGWTAKPEHRFTLEDERVILDVYGEHTHPAPHQTPVAWEVQLAHQTHGDFTERTQRIARVAGVHTNWVTPLDEQLDGHQGIVTNHTAELVVARLYTAPDEDAPPLPPMPLPQFIKAVSTRHPKLRWSASGENNRFIAYPRDSVGNTPTRPKPAPQLGTLEVEDRQCARPPIDRRPLVRRDKDSSGFAVVRGSEVWTHDDFRDAADICRDVTIGRQRQCITLNCSQPATDISGLCRKCINDRLNVPQP